MLTLLLLAAFISLGFWQLDRAEQKRRLLADYAAARAAEPKPLPSPAPAADDRPQRVRLSGELTGRVLLLDNQFHDAEAGVRVWTPLRRDDGQIIMVDQGWLPDPGRGAEHKAGARLPPQALAAASPRGRASYSGLWRPFPESGYALDNGLCNGGPAAAAEAVPRLQYPQHRELQCLFDAPLAEGLLLLDPDAGAGFLRDWQPEHLRPEVHLGYAVQWFGFALALLVIFIVVNRKRT